MVQNHSKKRKLFYFLIFASIHIMIGCGVAVNDQFSESIGLEAKNGYLLRGSGWSGKYGYALNDVNQIENNELIVAVQVNNHSQGLSGIGPILPVLPTLGTMNKGYDSTIPNNEKGIKITVALYGKTDKNLFFNPCDIVFTKGNKSIRPIQFKTIFQDIEYSYSYSQVSNTNNAVIPGKGNDILYIELFYREETSPQNDISVSFPSIDNQGTSIQLKSFKFKKGKGAFWTSIL